MSKKYQTKVEHQVEAWISKHKTKYAEALSKERADTGTKIVGMLVSVGLILGLVFKTPPATIAVYAVISAAIIFYNQTAGATKRARLQIRSAIFAGNPKLKENYDKEVLASGIGSKVPDVFIKSILIIFGLLILAAVVFG